MNEYLVYDVGANNGDDTAYYLSRGFRVVAVEANPASVGALQARFSAEIASGRVVVVPVAICEHAGAVTFYINDAIPEFSSIFEDVGMRSGLAGHAITVDGAIFSDILAEHGVPYYLKIDIERADGGCLASLSPDDLPAYVSVEAHCLDYLLQLRDSGYTRFKLVDQSAHNWPFLPMRNENPIGRVVNALSSYAMRADNKYFHLLSSGAGRFPRGSSGPLPEETPGPWQSFEEVMYTFLHHHFRQYGRGRLNHRGWFDFLAGLPD